MYKLTYNDFYGKESLEKEYKEFTFNCAGLCIDNKIAEKLCKTNIFNFNTDVINNLKKYIDIYLPKYTCCFFNTKITNASFIIGINDYGIVKGIPYKGYFPIKFIKKYIFYTIYNKIKIDTNESINLKKYIKIKINNINLPNKPNNNHNEKFIKYLHEKEKYIKLLNDYIKNKNQWRNNLASISRKKLVDLVNNLETRILLLNYIKLKDPTNITVKLLESDYKLDYKDHEEIIILKNDKNNIYYWLTQWKDEIITQIQLEKPIFIPSFNQHYLPLNLIISCNEMIPYWIHNNENMKLYVIQVKFKLLNLNVNLKYLNENNKWISYKRILLNGYPSSCKNI